MSDKMERLHPWPDPLPLGKKLSELTIQCPKCNNREHRMTIIATELVPGEKDQGLILECDNCKARFSLPQCKLRIS